MQPQAILRGTQSVRETKPYCYGLASSQVVAIGNEDGVFRMHVGQQLLRLAKILERVGRSVLQQNSRGGNASPYQVFLALLRLGHAFGLPTSAQDQNTAIVVGGLQFLRLSKS